MKYSNIKIVLEECLDHWEDDPNQDIEAKQRIMGLCKELIDRYDFDIKIVAGTYEKV